MSDFNIPLSDPNSVRLFRVVARSLLESRGQTLTELSSALERIGADMELHPSDIEQTVQEIAALRSVEQSVVATTGNQMRWGVNRQGNTDQIVYGEGQLHPQYAALHLDSCYFRLISHPGSGWGTSIVLLPSFWEVGRYWQGAPVTMRWNSEGQDLVGSFTGEISGLRARGQLRLPPPEPDMATAIVTVALDGNASFDTRHGEGFKPVALSSMHTAADAWDANRATVEFQSYAIPEAYWIIDPPVKGRVFGLNGGTSKWKENAPTIEIVLDRPMQISGWVTPSSNPNDDNVSVWAAPDSPIRFWEYRIFARISGGTGLAWTQQ